MRLVADENVHGKIVAHLRASGYELEWIKESARSALDEDILRRPGTTAIVLITDDRDFGDLIFAQGFPPPGAVLYTRTPHREWRLTAELLIRELERGVSPGQMTIITASGVRHKPFPIGAEHG